MDVDIKKLKQTLKNFSKKSIIVGHLAPYVISKTKTKMIIVLRKSPYKLLSIYKKRKYSKEKISENLGSKPFSTNQMKHPLRDGIIQKIEY